VKGTGKWVKGTGKKRERSEGKRKKGKKRVTGRKGRDRWNLR